MIQSPYIIEAVRAPRMEPAVEYVVYMQSRSAPAAAATSRYSTFPADWAPCQIEA